MRVDVPASAPSPSRFIAVHFPQWPLDAARVALWRAILRLRRTAVSDTPPDASTAASEADAACRPHAPGTPRGQERAAARSVLAELSVLPSVVVEGGHAPGADRMARIIGCCPHAAKLGLSVGMTVAQAEAVSSRGGAAVDLSVEGLVQLFGPNCARQEDGAASRLLRRWIVESTCAALVLRADEPAWGAMLRRLAACLERWVPRIAIDGLGASDPIVPSVDAPLGSRYSLLGDLAGCAALFRVAHGTEQVLMRRIVDSFASRGFETQLATASTIGAAIALASHGRHARAGRDSRCRAVPPGREAEALDPLPVEALRIPPAALQALHAVEVRVIGQLARLRRGGVAARLAGRVDGETDGAVGYSAGDARSNRRGAAFGRKRGRKAERMPAPSLFDRPAEGDAPCKAPDLLRDDGILIGGRDIGDPLLRLDQALGRSAEALIPLRMQEPVQIGKAFDGPTSRLDAVLVACGELVDRLATALEARREGMRVSRWIFHHAELPSDLSTDATVRRARTAHGHPPSSGRLAAGRMVSELELRLSAPTASRAHLWSMLQPKLEHLPLDHGIEEIIVRIEDAARMRSVQRRLLWQRVEPPPQQQSQAVRSRSIHVRPESQGVDRAERRQPSVWSGLDGACAGWISADRVSPRMGDADARCSDSAGLQEWIDLVAARFGRERVHRVPDLAREGDRARDMQVGDVSKHAADGSGGVAVHLGQRPSQWFAAEEQAVILGGSSSGALAATIAERRVWCFDSAHVRQPAPAMTSMLRWAPMLRWRGRMWPLSAIDGWERTADRWWDRAWEPEAPDASELQEGECESMSVQGIGRAAAIARLSGRLHARVQIGTGLWLLARFPDRIIPQGAEGRLAQVADDGAVVLGSSPDPWRDRCERAFQAGLGVSILGAWG